MTELEDARECWEQALSVLRETCKDIPTSAVPTFNPVALAAAEAFQRYWRLRAGPAKFAAPTGKRGRPRMH